MGLIRLTLALAVVVAHVDPLLGLRFFGGGVMAVETFFILSGFYMALVLTGRYRDDHRSFYFNRFLRLFPLYWTFLAAFLILSLGYWAAAGHPLGALASWRTEAGPWRMAWGVISNLTMVGCDWAELLVAVAPDTGEGVNRLILIQPTWSLSVEILFYLLAPFILRRGILVQGALFAGALLIRWALWSLGGNQWSPWLYFFSPASWVFFMAGIFSFHLYRWLEPQAWFARHSRALGRIFTGALVLLIVGYVQLDLLRFQDWRYYSLVALALPFVFSAFRVSRLDNAIAGWSYPVYLGHSVVLNLYAPLRHFIPDSWMIYAVLLATAVLVGTTLAFDERIQRRFKKRVATAPAVPQTLVGMTA